MVVAAVCPHPPALIPEVGRGLPELASIRAAVTAAVARLVGAERVVVLGPGNALDRDESAGGSLSGFGLEVCAGGPERVLPAPVTVGAWLLDQAGWDGRRRYVTPDRLEALTPGDTVLVLADGDTGAGVSTDIYGDPDALAALDAVAGALATGDTDTLVSLDLVAATRWEATGLAPLQALGRLFGPGPRPHAQLITDESPFGIRYWVAEWSTDR